jgi:hypothetical protein
VKIKGYPLQLRERQLLALPVGAKILSVQCQDNQLILWARVDENELTEDRVFGVYEPYKPLLLSIGQYLETVRVINVLQQTIDTYFVFEIKLP